MTSRGRSRSLTRSSQDIHAILTGTCTQLIFPVTLPSTCNHRGKWVATTVGGGSTTHPDGSPVPQMAAIWHTGSGKTLTCPYGQIGDRLWIKEAWQHDNFPAGPYEAGCTVFYRADYLDDPHGADSERSREGRYRTWQPATRMPRNASRLTVELTGVHAAQSTLSGTKRGAATLDLFPEALAELSGWQWILDIALHVTHG